ncbi:MAG: dihydrofolate reductase [Sclerophora amabilis]|nr:MAG: dihydrofolate reductase [Sclerophora amabilis]
MARSPISLTLILAATRKMGIGLDGGLPWPSLKSEMAYFARVTKRAPASTINAVIMGRKTWESIPSKYRPLRNRLNIVVSRQKGFDVSGPGGENGVVVESVEKAVDILGDEQALQGHIGTRGKSLGRVFVIGGAQIYKAALALEETRRILLTEVKTTFDCDTFFPLDLENAEQHGWVKKNTEDLEAWAGEEDLHGLRSEEQVEFEFCMYEKEERN